MAIIKSMGMDSVTGQLKYAVPGDNFSSPGSFIGTGAAPSLVLAAGAGTGASVAIVGSNVSGKITLTSGTIGLVSGLVLTMTFADALAYPNGCFITFSASDANFSLILNTLYCTTTTTTVLLNARVALSISTVYTGFYSITGY